MSMIHSAANENTNVAKAMASSRGRQNAPTVYSITSVANGTAPMK